MAEDNEKKDGEQAVKQRCGHGQVAQDGFTEGARKRDRSGEMKLELVCKRLEAGF